MIDLEEDDAPCDDSDSEDDHAPEISLETEGGEERGGEEEEDEVGDADADWTHMLTGHTDEVLWYGVEWSRIELRYVGRTSCCYSR